MALSSMIGNASSRISEGLDYWLGIMLCTLSNIEMDDLDTFSDNTAFEAMVAEAAYYRANQRGFTLGYALGDWLDAEKELLADFDVN